MEALTVDGLVVRVHTGGEAGGGALPVLYLHSPFGEVGRTPFATELEAHRPLLAPELPGFGASDTPPWRSIDDAVFWLRRLLDDCGWETGTVVGSSLGGWLAAELAVWFPERVRELVLLAPLGIRVEGAPLTDFFMLGRDEMIAALVHRLPDDVEAVLRDALTATDGNLLLHFYRALEATARLGWNPFLHDPRLADRLAGCDVPATVVWGEADRIVPRAYAEAFAGLFPQGRFVVLPDAGHLPVVEDGTRAAAVVAESIEPVVHR